MEQSTGRRCSRIPTAPLTVSQALRFWHEATISKLTKEWDRRPGMASERHRFLRDGPLNVCPQLCGNQAQ
jgi:hypothetical protein